MVVGVGGEAFKRVERDGRRRWKRLKAEATAACLEMTDRASLRHHQTKSKERRRSDQGKAPGGAQAKSGAPGLTHKRCCALVVAPLLRVKLRKSRGKQRCMSA